MNKEKGSLMSEATLWQLYRHLLADSMLASRLAPQDSRRHESPTGRSPAVAAALAANLLPGDTLGLSATDLSTRLARGLPLHAIRDALRESSPAAAEHRTGRRSKAAPSKSLLIQGWSAADADHGILPTTGDATGEQQAAFAVGTALCPRLTGSVTFLVATVPADGAAGLRSSAPSPIWARAAQKAVALQLPLIFLTESRGGSPHAVIPANPKVPASRLPVIPVNRNDAVALYRVLYESVSRARTQGGPTWIDCQDLPEPSQDLPQPSRGTALQSLEATLRARQFFDRARQRKIERDLARQFTAAKWPLPAEEHTP